jgi:hypothetical protein
MVALTARARKPAAKKRERRNTEVSKRGHERLLELFRGTADTDNGELTPAHVCAEFWVEAIAAGVVRLVATGGTKLQVSAEGLIRSKPGKLWPELARAGLHPLPGQVVCRGCGVPYPPQYFNAKRDLCFDCATAEMTAGELACLPPSTSAAAFEYIAACGRMGVGVRVVERVPREARAGQRIRRDGQWHRVGR